MSLSEITPGRIELRAKSLQKGFERFRSNLARLLEVPEWNLDNTHARSSVILHIVLFTNTVLGLWPIPKSWVKITQGLCEI